MFKLQECLQPSFVCVFEIAEIHATKKFVLCSTCIILLSVREKIIIINFAMLWWWIQPKKSCDYKINWKSITNISVSDIKLNLMPIIKYFCSQNHHASNSNKIILCRVIGIKKITVSRLTNLNGITENIISQHNYYI